MKVIIFNQQLYDNGCHGYLYSLLMYISLFLHQFTIPTDESQNYSQLVYVALHQSQIVQLNLYNMNVAPPINLKKWVEDNRHLLKPPVGNKVIYKDSEFIIMIVGGPNCRKDFHYNEGEEFFYQLEGDMNLPILENGKIRNIEIKEGEIFLLPPRVPHSPQRKANTVGLVVERVRAGNESDSCMWYCENCSNLLHQATFHLDDIVTQLPVLMQSFYDNVALRTCNVCGTIMETPKLENNAQ